MTISRKTGISLLVALALIATLIVGATLAFLTASTSPVTNVFTVGNIGGQEAGTDLTEITPEAPLGDATEGIYDMLPGATEIKTPIFTVAAGSVDAYAYLRVIGVDALAPFGFNVDFNEDGAWIPVDVAAGGVDGIYRYATVVDDTMQWDPSGNASRIDSSLTPIFTEITLGAITPGQQELLAEAAGSLPQIVFEGFVIQTANLPISQADEEAINHEWAD